MSVQSASKLAPFWPPLEHRLRWALAGSVLAAVAAWLLIWGPHLPSVKLTSGTVGGTIAIAVFGWASLYSGYIKPLGPRHAGWLIYSNRIRPNPESLLEVIRDIFASDKISDWLQPQVPANYQKRFDWLSRRVYSLGTNSGRRAMLRWIGSYLREADGATLVSIYAGYPDDWDPDPKAFCSRLRSTLLDHRTKLCWADEMAAFWNCLESSLGVTTIPSILTMAGILEQTRATLEKRGFFRPELAEIVKQELQAIALLRRYVTSDALEMRLAFLSKTLVALEQCGTTVRQKPFGIEAVYLNRGLRRWKQFAQAELDTVQGTARLKLTFETRQVVREPRTTLIAVLENEGRGYAENVAIAIEEGPGYTLTPAPASPASIDLLPSNATQKLRLEIINGPVDEFIITVRLTYEDVGGAKSQVFTEKIDIVKQARSFVDFYNPYEKGQPIRDRESRIFFGREDVFADIARILESDTQKSSGKSIVLLVGERRMGKTSVLLQLDFQLPDKYLPVFLDLQGFNGEGDAQFLYWLGTSLSRALKEKGFHTELPSFPALREAPTPRFLDFVHEKVLPALGTHHVVLLFDEFEHMRELIQKKKQDDGILLFLRNLMQHVPGLSFVFAGTQLLEELASEYQSIMFNIAHTIRLQPLSLENSNRLVIEPVAGMLEYESGAPDSIYQLARGHPFFTQLLCYEIVEQQKRNQKSYTTLTDVEDAARRVVETGQSHFDYIFEKLTPLERLVLSGMSSWISTQRSVLVSDLVGNLSRYTVPLSLLEGRKLLDKLVQRGVLIEVSRTSASERGGEYVFSMDLVRRWLLRHRPFEQVLDQYISLGTAGR